MRSSSKKGGHKVELKLCPLLLFKGKKCLKPQERVFCEVGIKSRVKCLVKWK